MWLLELILFLLTLAVAGSLFGYFIIIWFIGLITPTKQPVPPDRLPRISVIIPCFNEEELILKKLADIRAFDYPTDRLEIIFVDGGSSDATVSLLKKDIGRDEPISVLVSPSRGKICQINHALSRTTGEIIVNTDTDVILEPETAKWLAAEFASDKRVWVVGAYVRPLQGLDIDMHHWDAHNKSRFMETDFWSSSIVLAPCYAFRRELLDAFPDDVVADDIFIALRASVLGHRVILSRMAKALEIRNAMTFPEFVSHKYRKANAFLREYLRFLYVLPYMNAPTKFIFLGRITQQLVLPWAFLSWLMIMAATLTMFRVDLVLLSLAFVFLSALGAKAVFNQVKLPDETRSFSFLTQLKGNLIVLGILFTTGISYPWFGQDSSYSRIGASACGSEGLRPGGEDTG